MCEIRRFLAATLIVALPSAALAQTARPIEKVEVDANKTLTGLWKLFLPPISASVSLPLMGTGKITYNAGETFCRMDPDSDGASMACLSGSWLRDGTASLDGKNLHLAWGDAMMRLVIDAVPQSASSFSGTFAVKFMGIPHDAAQPATGERFDNPVGTPDPAGKTALLTTVLEQLAAGAITLPHDAAFASNLWHADPNKPADVALLGKIQAVIYLGEGQRRRSDQQNKPLPPFVFSAYQVEFTNGQRLCGIHQREDGVLDGFLCV